VKIGTYELRLLTSMAGSQGYSLKELAQLDAEQMT
jgi:hypothetical protein